jgi:hypothetical protein
MGLRRVFGIVFASLGFASLLYSIYMLYFAFYEATNLLSAVGAFIVFVLVWLVSTVLYVAGYLISLGVKSRLLAVLFTVGGAINLFIGSAQTVYLIVFVRKFILFIVLLLSIIILVGIAFILAGRRKL